MISNAVHSSAIYATVSTLFARKSDRAQLLHSSNLLTVVNLTVCSSPVPSRLKIIAPLLSRFPRVIAIGPQTAKELQHYDIDCETLTSFYSRDFVPFLGEWIRGKHIGIPRADVPNPSLINAITAAGGIPHEFRCYGLVPTGESLFLEGADAILFTSAMSFTEAVWTKHPEILVIAIGDITAEAMRGRGTNPAVVGDGSLEGAMMALNNYLTRQRR